MRSGCEIEVAGQSHTTSSDSATLRLPAGTHSVTITCGDGSSYEGKVTAIRRRRQSLAVTLTPPPESERQPEIPPPPPTLLNHLRRCDEGIKIAVLDLKPKDVPPELVQSLTQVVGIQGAEAFVEDDHLRTLEQGSSDIEPAFLPILLLSSLPAYHQPLEVEEDILTLCNAYVA